MIYLAGPYSHESSVIKNNRFEKLTDVAAQLMNEGNIVYSPITHSHPIAIKHSLPGDWGYWQASCEAMLSRCDKMVIVKMEGWEKSVGLAGEIEIANALGIPIEYYKGE